MYEIIFYFALLIQFVVLSFFLHIIILVFIPKNKKPAKINSGKFYSFDVYIPVFRELEIVQKSVESLNRQNYPKDKISIIVIADHCEYSELEFSNYENVKLLKVNFEKSSKVSSLKYAYSCLEKKSDYVIILDVDNICEENFLSEINKSIVSENFVIQGQRSPNNLISTTARLDAFTDYFYNYVDRYSASLLNLSSPLPGSGTAVPYFLFEKYILTMDTFGGYDKIFHNRLILDGFKIIYNDNAIVYDQKISNQQHYTNQRARWMFSYINSLKKFSLLQLSRFFVKFNFDSLHFYFINSRPPLAFLFLLLIISLIFSIFTSQIFSFIWLSVLFMFFLVIILSMKHYKADKRQYFILFSTPILIFRQIIAFSKIRKAKKSSLATNHSKK